MHVKCLVFSKCSVSEDYAAAPASPDSAALILCLSARWVVLVMNKFIRFPKIVFKIFLRGLH